MTAENIQESSYGRDNPTSDQDISTQELVDTNYDVDMERSPNPLQDTQLDQRRGQPWGTQPGRHRNDDSINASQNDKDRKDEGHETPTGYESPSATRVGKEDDPAFDPHLNRINEGRDRTDGDLRTRQNEWDKQRIAEAICSQLPISKLQRKKIVTAMEALDFGQFGQQKAIERVCLGTAAVIVNDDRAEEGEDPDEVTLLSWEDEFQAIAEEHDVKMSDLSTIKKIVRNQIAELPLKPVTAGRKRDTHLPKMSPADKPDEYWERFTSGNWVHLAKTWEMQRKEYEDAIPDEKRELIEKLRKWKPWNRYGDNTEKESEAVGDVTVTEASEQTIEDDGVEYEFENWKILSSPKPKHW